jgi:hypothetical protein
LLNEKPALNQQSKIKNQQSTIVLLEGRSQRLVLVFLAVPKDDGRGVFALALLFHVNAEDGLLLQGESFHGESFEGRVDQKKFGLGLFRAPCVLFRAVNDEQTNAASVGLVGGDSVDVTFTSL